MPHGHTVLHPVSDLNLEESCNKVKTREFEYTQMLSTLARQLETDPSLFMSAMSDEVTGYTYRVLPISGQRLRGRPKIT